jgi:beta-N-acetylhexosaminidase
MAGDGSLARLAAACLLPGFAGTTAPDWVRRRAAAGLGGVVLYGRNVASPEQLAELCAELRVERPALLVAIDEEGGDVTRLETATGSSYPGNLALGAAGDPALTRQVGAAIGADLASVGVNLDLAPVADVNSNPANPIIGVRSFGADPRQVAVHVAAMVEGLQGAGVAACAKHFPGHGDTVVDSHLGLPTVNSDREALSACELEPFRAAIRAGARCIMTGHLRVPAYDQAPATVSRPILTGLLRQEFGFGGMVVTDALEMAAVAATLGMAEGAVRALAAGADALCTGGEHADESIVWHLQDALVAAVREGRLAEERLAAAAASVAEVAAWATTTPPHPATRPPHQGAGRGVGLEAARRALLAEGKLPLGHGALVVELSPATSIAVGQVRWGLGEPLRRRDPTVEVLGGVGPPVDAGALASRAAGRPLLVVVRDLHRHPWQEQAVRSLLGLHPQLTLVEMGLPALRPEGTGAYLRTFGAARVNAEAAAELLRP